MSKKVDKGQKVVTFLAAMHSPLSQRHSESSSHLRQSPKLLNFSRVQTWSENSSRFESLGPADVPDIITIECYVICGASDIRYTVCPIYSSTGLGWLEFWVLHLHRLPDSAWAGVNLAEADEQLGKMVDHPNQIQPNPEWRFLVAPRTRS